MATKHVVVKASLLPDVVGRVDYISNPEKQEHLFAFYQTPASPETFWKELSEVSSERASYNRGRDVIEAREHIIQLPNDLLDGDHAELARKLAEAFKKEHNVECAVGIHWNADETNYHAHLVFPERRLQGNQKVSIAGRDTYFDANGSRSTKSKCVGADGTLLPGCSVVRKGEAFPVKKFSGKDDCFRHKAFLRGEKQRYAEMFSEMSVDKWIVYDHSTNPHMRLLNLKRGEPAGLRAWKESENKTRKAYNAAIDKMLDSGEITMAQALQIKKQLYAEQAAQRARRKEEREEWRTYYETKREAYRQSRHTKAQARAQIRFTDDGRKRTTVELVAILGLTLAGIDLFKDTDVNDDVIVVPKPQCSNPAVVRRFQERIDRIYHLAGQKSPAEMMAERRVARLAKDEQRRPSLLEQIGGAEALKEKTPGKSREPERSGVDPPEL